MAEGKVRNTYLCFGNINFTNELLELPETGIWFSRANKNLAVNSQWTCKVWSIFPI